MTANKNPTSALNTVETTITKFQSAMYLLTKVCETFAVFIYMGAVFFAQWTLSTSRDCLELSHDDFAYCYTLIEGYQLWLIIETLSFYAYMVANCVYIFGWSLYSTAKNQEISDLAKQEKDFILYSASYMNWFALSFLICVMPPIMILTVY